MTMTTFPDDELLYQNLPAIEMNSAEMYGAFSDLRTEIISSTKKNYPSCRRPTELRRAVMRDVKAKYGDLLTVLLLVRIAWAVWSLCRWIWSVNHGR